MSDMKAFSTLLCLREREKKKQQAMLQITALLFINTELVFKNESARYY